VVLLDVALNNLECGNQRFKRKPCPHPKDRKVSHVGKGDSSYRLGEKGRREAGEPMEGSGLIKTIV
jgi:hypothetical protein